MLLKKIFQLLPGDLLHPVQLDIDEYNQKLLERNAVLLKCIEYKKGNIFNYYISVARKGVKD
jgi:2-polyprenyl-6-hydroxyphenyl methylase/3-demethylubiquinone-9 3-methyltransferase